MAILGWPSRPTRPIRADRRTPVRAPPSVQRFRSIRCARPTRPRPVRIRRKWLPEAPCLDGQRRGSELLQRGDLALSRKGHDDHIACVVKLERQTPLRRVARHLNLRIEHASRVKVRSHPTRDGYVGLLEDPGHDLPALLVVTSTQLL